ncbi:MAG: cation transporter [Candidatus Nitronauta litoralis]|uniref:Cation transporter n=1 Tax=Candidatus Nitronauta litoralis TaxID=2705533 RepID=A0A7T0BYS2_9BACT|nr:MAG: cation transporter [Candidatus Nitronauta litoralis]
MSSCSSNCGEDLNDILKNHRKILWVVLWVNLGMFFVEIAFGWVGKSHALWADSLDMLGDALVFGASILVLKAGEKWKARAALGKGILMGVLSIGLFLSAIFRFLEPLKPDPEIIGGVGALALVANIICAFCLFQYRNQDLNMRSTWLCARNDILANLGVIIAAWGIYMFHSPWPDIVVAILICLFVLNSSISIIKEAQKELSEFKTFLKKTA